MIFVVFVLILLLAAAPAFDESFRAGLLALQRNDLSAAQANLEAASQLAPKNARVWIALSQTYWKLKENAKADAAAAKAEAHGARDAVVQSSLAIYYAESGRVLKSVEAQARYATLVPAEPAARERAESTYFQIAQPLLEQGKFPEAIDVLTTATRNVKNSAQLELALGVACYALRRFDQAASAFINVIAIAPETEQPYVFLGKFLDQIQSRLPEVTTRFIKYETANPANSLGYYLHAKALNIQSIEPENTRKLLEKALELNERDS